MKPFNFLLVGHVRPFGLPVGVDPTRLQPVAPYESDPTQWRQLPWIDRYSGKWYRVAGAADREDPEPMQLQTYRDILRGFHTHPEAKSAGADGMACGRHPLRLRGRRVVWAVVVAHGSKEANKLEEVEAGLEHDPDVLYTEYYRPDRDAWSAAVLPGLQLAEANELARLTGLSSRSIKAIRNGTQYPRQPARARISRVVKELECLS